MLQELSGTLKSESTSLVLGLGGGELLLEDGHWEEVPFPPRGAELTVTEGQDSCSSLRAVSLLSLPKEIQP